MAKARAQMGKTNSGEVVARMLDALVREYGADHVRRVSDDVAEVDVPWSYSPPDGPKQEGRVTVRIALSIDGLLEAYGDQVVQYAKRGAILAATQAARTAAQRGTTAQESLARQLARLRERAAALGVDLEALLG